MKKLARFRTRFTDLLIIFLLNVALVWNGFIITEGFFTGCIQGGRRNDTFYCYSDSPGMFLFTIAGHIMGMVLGAVIVVLLYKLLYGSANKGNTEQTITSVDDIVEAVRRKENITESDMIQKMRREERMTSNDDITIIRTGKD